MSYRGKSKASHGNQRRVKGNKGIWQISWRTDGLIHGFGPMNKKEAERMAFAAKVFEIKDAEIEPVNQSQGDSHITPKYVNGVLFEWDYKAHEWKKATTGKYEDSGLG